MTEQPISNTPPPPPKPQAFLDRAKTAVLNFLQWIVFAFAALVMLGALLPLGKLDVPGVNIPLVIAAAVCSVAVAVAQLPPLFWRMSANLRGASYIALIASFAFTVSISAQVQNAYALTAAGQKEAGDLAASDRQAAAEAARQAAAEKQEKDAEAQQVVAQQQAGRDAQKADLCNTLSKQVVDGDKVLELNNVAVETSVEPNETLTCSGDAITSHGNMRIEFGLISTPQGKALLSIRYP
jgi:hypothetical protein